MHARPSAQSPAGTGSNAALGSTLGPRFCRVPHPCRVGRQGRPLPTALRPRVAGRRSAPGRASSADAGDRLPGDGPPGAEAGAGLHPGAGGAGVSGRKARLRRRGAGGGGSRSPGGAGGPEGLRRLEKGPESRPPPRGPSPRPLRPPSHSHALWPFGAARGRGAPLQWGFRGPAPGPGARPGRGSRPLLRGGGRPGGPGPAAALCG